MATAYRLTQAGGYRLTQAGGLRLVQSDQPAARSGWQGVGSPPGWAAVPGGVAWQAAGSVPGWVAGGPDVPGEMVRNTIKKAPEDDSPRHMDFGECPELQAAGVTVASCTVTEVTTSALTISGVQVEANGYRVDAVITGGVDGTDYLVKFLATLSNGKHVARTATLQVRS